MAPWTRLPVACPCWTGLCTHLASLSHPLFTPSSADLSLGLVFCWVPTLPAPGPLRGQPDCPVRRPCGHGVGGRGGGREPALPAPTPAAFTALALTSPRLRCCGNNTELEDKGHREVQLLAQGHTAGFEPGLSDGEGRLYPRDGILQINETRHASGAPDGPPSLLGVCPWP